MRDAFSKSLVDIAKKDPNVILLTGDHGYALFDEFRKIIPNQYINAGIAEQNMVGMAAGLARVGFRPFVYGLSAFIPIRVLEQIKIDIAHDNLPIVLLGDGAGFVYSHLGTSHQSTEDISATRSLPNLTVLSPCDRYEMTASMELAYQLNSPVYLRMGKSDRGDIHNTRISNFELGKIICVKESSNKSPALLATGSMVKTALEASKEIKASVWSVPSIKPLDPIPILDLARKSNEIITLEEHSIYGGMGSAVSEILGEFLPKKILRLGVNDVFSNKCGSYEYLLKEHELDINSVKNKISIFLKNSNKDY